MTTKPIHFDPLALYRLARPATVTLAIMLAACSGTSGDDDTPTPTPSAEPAEDYTSLAVVVSTDYETGTYGLVNIDDLTAEAEIGLVHSDATGRIYGSEPVIINRLYADNLQFLDPSAGFETDRQYSVGDASNPQDVAFHGDSVYVTQYETDTISIFDTLTGDATGTIDLSAFSDADGLPEMAGIRVVGDTAFVGVQRLDRDGTWSPVGDGVLAVVDLSTGAVVDVDSSEDGVQGIPLAYANPTGQLLRLSDDQLVVLTVGDYFNVGDGGIEIIDTQPPYSGTVVLDETTVGGDMTAFATLDGVVLFAVVNTVVDWESFTVDTSLVKYDVSSGDLTTLFVTDGYAIGDISVTAGGKLLVCDRTVANPGIRIFDASSGDQITTDPIDVGLPPVSILAFDAPTEVLP